jgi:hypothetical protein
MTGGRGPDAVIEGVGMEAAHSPIAKMAHAAVGLLPDAVAEPTLGKVGIDRMGPCTAPSGLCAAAALCPSAGCTAGSWSRRR